ncbi:MAG: HAD family phosphatase [Synergistaceae bacterium]|jgi:HAD superfamily hydrolase (TIGR01549 family)|nr:HAD family phosphatase [Synergistaceae bacterium]
MKKDKIRGIIFDLDGTLFNSEYYQWQAWAKPLQKLGIKLTKKAYCRYAGKNRKTVERELIKDYNLKIKNGVLLEAKRKLIEKWANEKKLELMPYSRESVEFFANNSNFIVALCSGGNKKETIAKLKNNDFLKYFSIIISDDEVKRGKPSPDIYSLTIKKMGLKPKECLAFEDTQHGLMSAKTAGAKCFSIPNEYTSTQNFSNADRILSSLKEAIVFFKILRKKQLIKNINK